jgi:uncharacterized protein (DUF58 family)
MAVKSEERKGEAAGQRAAEFRTQIAEAFSEDFLKEIEKLYIISKKVFAGRLRAQRRAKKLGSGVEFAEHRDYAPGDDFRYIDWNLYGRMDKLFLRLFEEEEDLHVYILLDVSNSMTMGSPPKFLYAMQLGAALAYIALSNLDRVGFVPFADRVLGRLPPTRGIGRIFKIFEFLKQTPIGGPTRLEPCLRTFIHQNQRRGVAVLISDFYDPAGFEEAVNTLRYNKYETYVVQVYDQKEVRPDLMGDLHLVDCETGERREVTISPKLLAEYAKEHELFCAELETFCKERAIPLFRTHTGTPFQDLILDIFRMGGFIK